MPSPSASYLRVYEPMTAFSRERRSHWRRYIDAGRAVDLAQGPTAQRAAVLSALGAGWTRLPDLADDAYVVTDPAFAADDGPLVCPWDLRVRVALAALTAREGVPAVLADAFVPAVLAGQARAVIDEWRLATEAADDAQPQPHEQEATWGVPLRWFVFFDVAERELSVTPGARMLRYRTRMAQARRRAHRAVAVLRKAVGDAPITEAVEEAARWLESFHPRALVELDYGGIVDLLTDEELTADDSPALAATGLTGLGRADADAATQSYEALVTRWRAVQLRERIN
ncbi:hypothetical protein GCM10010124_30620 [Pilimelia terevasa]|uniref:DUF8083 domain-containing protein n=1 Tax=Pilimelia terevasa TaxID=53372 RepID=A0A8J3FKZ3_9ACTN|nr:hypothetical protein [Pilimelia terevasa]GGK35821.1 hypothetical protein GCM10010124_30620 [Pilimelia terevasa]